jgi:hypothetical protein
MVVTVKVPDELVALAQARGMSVEAYVREVLSRAIAHPLASVPPRTPEEIRDWLDSLSQFSEKVPPLPVSISREWLYQDHD